MEDPRRLLLLVQPAAVGEVPGGDYELGLHARDELPQRFLDRGLFAGSRRSDMKVGDVEDAS